MILYHLEARANTSPNKVCLCTSNESVTYAQLYERVCRMAYQLRGFAKSNVMLLFHPDDVVAFTVSFYACLMARAVAVPAPPTKYMHVLKDCNPRAICTSANLYLPIRWRNPLAMVHIVVEGAWKHCCCNGKLRQCEQEKEDLAFLQYTSGSTSNPKGVMITNGALEANLDFVCKKYLGNTNGQEVTVTWVPFYHDYGLTSILNCHVVGGTMHYISPVEFMKNPLFWLHKMTKVRATHTQAPNFAYGLCARHARIYPSKAEGIELSCVRQFSMGGEMIRKSTMDEFTSTFNVSMAQMDPSYGLAEMVCGIVHYQGSEPLPLEQDGVVNVGTISEHVEVKIMKDSEVWVRGDMMMAGFWGKKWDEGFGFAEGKQWVKTGDLGFVRDGCLYITGRKKDVIILNGKNIVATDVEWVVQEAFPELRPGSIAAVPIITKGKPEELGLIAELRDMNIAPTVKQVRRVLYERMQVPVHQVLFVPRKTLPKTSSGKLQRFQCRAMFGVRVESLKKNLLNTQNRKVH